MQLAMYSFILLMSQQDIVSQPPTREIASNGEKNGLGPRLLVSGA